MICPGQIYEVVRDVIQEGYGIPVFKIVPGRYYRSDFGMDIKVGERFILDRQLKVPEIPFDVHPSVNQWRILHWTGVWRISELDIKYNCCLIGV